MFIQTTNTSEALYIGVVYRPPSGSKSAAILELENLIQNLPSKRVIILGDFNDDLFKTDSQNFESLIYGNNMTPLISLATHFKPGSNPSLIDNVLTNSVDNLKVAGVFESGVSHHRPIFCFVDDEVPKSEKIDSNKPRYDYCETNLNNFEKEIEEMSNKDIDYSEKNFDSFVNEIKNKIEENFKVTSTRTSKRNIFSNPWITPGIINSVNKKHHLYVRWRRSITKVNKHGSLELYEIYKKYRKELKSIIKQAKRKYYSTKFNSVSGNMKKTWALINELRGKTKSRIKSCFKVDGRLIYSKRDIANGFNQYFSSIARKMNVKVRSSQPANGSLNTNTNRNFQDFLSKQKRIHNSIFLYQCSSEDILKVIKDFEVDKASDISVKVLKRIAKYLSGHLSGFINHFMQLGIFPKLLKIGKISPIFKKDDAQLFDNYRPISVLPIFGKVFEKILYDRLYNFFTSNSVIHNKQFGFRKCHSTGHAINYSINKITNELQKRNHVIGLFIDLSKAFDTIDHEKLLIKLEYYGIRGICLELIKSYLCNRQQYTEFNGTNSDLCSIKYGVPQGSVLGPLLFLIYINDLIKCNISGCDPYDNGDEFVLFADDTNIFVVGKDEDKAKVYQNAQELLHNINNYMYSNQLHINF